jgi:alcohol dehydrogenase (NADP+)
MATTAEPQDTSEATRGPTVAKGWGTDAPDQPLRPMEFERRALRPDDVAIRITYAGICHSDLHTARNDWGGTRYPCIPGHEIVGTVTAIGDDVTRHRVGDTVAVGCMVDSCMECDQCLEGWEVFCRKGCVQTYNSADYHDGTISKGGYTDHIVVRDHFVLQGAGRHGRQQGRAFALRRHHDLLAAQAI